MMKTFLRFIGILAAVGIVAVIIISALLPWMDRWGATEVEINASFPGDELVPSPVAGYTRAVTVNADPADIYPWLVQMGAEKGGMYSYEWLETNILRCELINADQIHPEWQGLKVGDKVKMCPGESGPPAFEVAQLEPSHALVLGHRKEGSWEATWQFILVPYTDGTTRLIARAREAKSAGIWNIIRPGQFIMERGMLLGIKERAEHLAETRSVRPVPEITPTPEIFIPLDEAIPEPEITLEGVHLEILSATLDRSFPAGCTGEVPACNPAQKGMNFLAITLKPRDLPEGQMLAYKNLPAVSVVMEGGLSASYSLTKYDNMTHTLTLGFEVPDSAAVFGLKWADLREIPLEIALLASQWETASFSEFGQNISLSYDPALTLQAETRTVPAVPPSDQIMFAEAHPAYAQIRFPAFQPGRFYDLPLLPWDDRVAQVRIFQTADFPGFGDDSAQGFVSQLQQLKALLETGLNAERCAQPLTSYEQALPFLPWINMQQAFCAQPEIIEFSGGKGIRYLSYYAQDPSPVMDYLVFYTFQGLTDDGQFYVAAFFPVQTGIFPADPPECAKCGDPNYNPLVDWQTVLTEQLNRLNNQPADDFVPSLTVLDEMITSIQIGP
jgi:hypothetical protein